MSASEPTCPECQAPGASGPPGTGACPRCGRTRSGPATRAAAGGRSVRPAVLAVASLLAIAFAAHRLYRISPEDATAAPAAAAGAATPPKPDDDGLDRAATHTRLVIVRGGEGVRPVVALAGPTRTRDPRALVVISHGLLARELVRQALLIAARDELGLATRDEVLGETLPTGTGGEEIDLAAVHGLAREELTGVGASYAAMLSGQGEHRAYLRRSDGRRFQTLWRGELPGPGEPADATARLVAAAEALSRDGFPGGLRKLGLEGKPNARRDDAGLPAGVEDGVDRLDFAGPFAAVRALHEAIRSDGESPARLGALVRGYALLGVLAEFHWHPAHKAFKARSLLYGQRLAARDPKGPWGLWHRAYAEALAGMHRQALADLSEARSRADAGGGPQPPDWVGLIEAYARDEPERLGDASGPHAGLAALLRMSAVEHPLTTGQTLRAAQAVVGRYPDCFRAVDTMCRVGGVSNLHVATEIGPQALARSLPEWLRALDSLPEDVRKAPDRPGGGEVALTEALDRAGAPDRDRGEPSWGALAHLVRETQFVQVYRRLHFMRVLWSVPVDEYWAGSRAAVAGHRFRPYLETLALPPRESARAFDALVERLDPTDLDLNEVDLLRAVYNPQIQDRIHLWSTALDNSDTTLARDLAELVQSLTPADQVNYARLLLGVSPHSRYARGVLLEHDWERAGPHLADWEKDSGDSPALLGALARRYSALGKTDEADRMLTRYIKLSPEHWAYAMLAGNRKARGDLKGWQAALDEFLESGADPGLEHARVRVEIADHYMGMGRWEEARPYAEEAAATWADWAMACAGRCAEGMRDWTQAELWARRRSERYPDTLWAAWYLFCERTGHGDAGAARAFADQFLEEAGGTAAAGTAGYFYWAGGEPKKAFDVFRKAYEATHSAPDCLGALMVADELGDAAARREFLDTLASKHRDQAPKTVQIWETFRDALDRGGLRPADLESVERLLQTIPAERRGNTEFIVAQFLKNHGPADDAQSYLRRVAGSPGVDEWMRLIARGALRGAGEGKARSSP